MTVSASLGYKKYSGNGVTVAFPTVFQFFDSTDIIVTVVSSAGVSTVKTLTTHYTVSGGSGSTGTVTMLTAPASGETLVLQRDVPYTQVTDYENNDSFPAASHELALDRVTMLAQQASRDALATPTLPITFDPDADTRPIMPLPVANKVLVGNSGATGWDNTAIADLSLASIPVTITSVASGDVLRYNGTVWVNEAIPTPSAGDNDTSIATTAFVQTAIGNVLSVSDAASSPGAAVRRLIYATLTASRTVTLPLASSIPAGLGIEIIDGSGSASQTVAISIARSGSDTIAGNAATQVCINVPRGSCILVSDGVSAWHVLKWSVVYTGVAIADVALNNTGTYFSGISVAQGTLGTWDVEGGISMLATDAAQNFRAALGDGTTNITAGGISSNGANDVVHIHLSGRISAPAANLAMYGNSPSTTNATTKFNSSGLSRDTFIKAVRVA